MLVIEFSLLVVYVGIDGRKDIKKEKKKSLRMFKWKSKLLDIFLWG